MTDFDAVIEVGPVNRKAARLNRPLGSLSWGGFRQPFQPRHFVERQAHFASVIKPDMKAIETLYRRIVSTKGVLLDRAVALPAEARPFVRTLTEYAARP